MQRPEYYLGIDIASANFYAAIGKAEDDQWHIMMKPKGFRNEYDELGQFLNWMQQHQLRPENTIICWSPQAFITKYWPTSWWLMGTC